MRSNLPSPSTWWAFGGAILVGGGFSAIFSSHQWWSASLLAPGAVCIIVAFRAKPPHTHVTAPMVVFPENDLKKARNDRLAYVENVGALAARDVQIQPIQIGIGIYTFRRIPLLRPGDRLPLELESAKATSGLDLFSLWDPTNIDHDHWLWIAAKDFLGDFTVPLTTKWIDPQRQRHYEHHRLHLSPDLVIETSTVGVGPKD
jgi:hypothetical protein